MVVGGKGAFGGCSGVPVVPERCCEGEEAGGDAGVDAGEGACAVVFQGELSFEGVEDPFDSLA